MKYLALLCFLVACAGATPLASEVDTQEYIFSQSNGRSFSQVLPADWAPQYEGGFIRINNRSRLLTMDVIMIRPRVPLDVNGLRRVRLVRRNEPTAGSSQYDLWVQDGIEDLLEAHPSLDLVKAAPQTWLRPNDFRILLER